MNSRSRNYCFTMNNYTDEDVSAAKSLKYKYIIIGDEIGEKGTPHLQGYVNFKDNMTFTALKKKLPRFHIEECKGSPQQNREYCSKEKVLFEDGELPAQGKRTDVDRVREQLQETGQMRDVVATATSVQSVRMAEIYLSYYERKRDWKPVIKWYWGPTGCGKSHAAYQESEDPYTCSDSNRWWQGYDAHEHVIIDDFRKDFIKFHDLLKLLDKYPYRIEYKGGSRQLLARQIIITCPHHPETVYETREDIEQLLRRIDEIKEFKEKYIFSE